MSYVLLLIAIGIEVLATSLLKSTDGFTRPLPTVACLCCYAISFVLLANIVKSLPIGVAYAIWAGLGTAAIAAIGVLFLDEPLTLVKVGGIALIVVGVAFVNLSGAR